MSLKHTSDCIWYNLPEIKRHLPNHTITIMCGSKKNGTERIKDNGYAHFRFAEIDTDSDFYGDRIPRPVSHNIWAYCYVVSTTSYEKLKSTKRLTFNLRKEVYEAAFSGYRTDHYFFVAGDNKTWFFSAEEMLNEIIKYNESVSDDMQVHVNYETLDNDKKFIRLPLFLMDSYSKETIDIVDRLDIDLNELSEDDPCLPLKSYIYNIQPTVYISHEEHMKKLHSAVSKSNVKRAIEKKNNTNNDFESMTKEEFIAKYSKKTYYRYQRLHTQS